MKKTWFTAINHWHYLFSQLTLIGVLFVYWAQPVLPTGLPPLFFAGVLGFYLTWWIEQSLFLRIDQARLQGHFQILRKTMRVHGLPLILVTGGFVGLYALFMTLLGTASWVVWGAVLIVLMALDKTIGASLRFQASAVLLQAHGLRRLVLVAGLVVGLLALDTAWVNEYLFVVLIASNGVSLGRLVVGHLQYYKEFRYRRQFEDSGERQTMVSVLRALIVRYATTFDGVFFAVLMLLTMVWIDQTWRPVTSGETLPRIVMTLLVATALARTNRTTLVPDLQPWRDHARTGHHAPVRGELGLLLERLLYRSLLLTMAWVVVTMALPFAPFVSFADQSSGALVVFGAGFYLTSVRLNFLTPGRERWFRGVIAVLLFVVNTSVLTVYYPAHAVYIGLAISGLWWHAAQLAGFVHSIGLEWRVHAAQSGKIWGVMLTSIAVNVLIRYGLRQAPLGVTPGVEDLLLLVLFALVTSVVVYSLTMTVGVQRLLRSRDDGLQHLSQRFMETEEEEAIW